MKVQDEYLLDIRQVAQRLGVGWMFVYKRIGVPGGIPALRIGRLWRFKWSAVLAWAERQKV